MKIEETLKKSNRIKRSHWKRFHIIWIPYENKFHGSNSKIFIMKPTSIFADDWEVYIENPFKFKCI